MVHKGTIAIREVQSRTNDTMTLEDHSYRNIGKKIANDYLEKKYKESDMPQWMWSVLYFFLGCLFFGSIPSFIELGRFFIEL